jgi:hypothetical protein
MVTSTEKRANYATDGIHGFHLLSKPDRLSCRRHLGCIDVDIDEYLPVLLKSCSLVGHRRERIVDKVDNTYRHVDRIDDELKTLDKNPNKLF